jgi:hypothetical protein
MYTKVHVNTILIFHLFLVPVQIHSDLAMLYVEAILTFLHISAQKTLTKMHTGTVEYLQNQCDYAQKAQVTYS